MPLSPADGACGPRTGAPSGYLLSAFAVISYTENAAYVLFAAMGSWLGAFASVTWLGRGRTGDAMERHNPP